MEAPASVPMLERYTACMVLAGVGDAMGYRNGRWEFNFSGAHHAILFWRESLTGHECRSEHPRGDAEPVRRH